MDGFCNQNADLLGSLAGLSFPVVYVGVVECAPASPYTYSSTHRFPDERIIIILLLFLQKQNLVHLSRLGPCNYGGRIDCKKRKR